jgi:hypothetical protein
MWKAFAELVFVWRGEATKQRVAKEVLGGDGVGTTESRKVSVTSCDARDNW